IERLTANHVKKERKNGNTVECTFVILRAKNGAIIHVELLRNDEGEYYSFDFIGDKGLLTYDSRESNPINGGTSTGTEDILNRSILERQLAFYVDCLESETELNHLDENSKKAMQIAMAAKESVSTGEPVWMERGDFS